MKMMPVLQKAPVGRRRSVSALVCVGLFVLTLAIARHYAAEFGATAPEGAIDVRSTSTSAATVNAPEENAPIIRKNKKENVDKLPEGCCKYAFGEIDAVKVNFEPGDRVDVVFTRQDVNGKSKPEIIVRNVLVLTINDKYDRHSGEKFPEKKRVCLAVTPEQSLAIYSAEKRGEVELLNCDSIPPSPVVDR
jgi:hypothetical protein